MDQFSSGGELVSGSVISLSVLFISLTGNRSRRQAGGTLLHAQHSRSLWYLCVFPSDASLPSFSNGRFFLDAFQRNLP